MDDILIALLKLEAKYYKLSEVIEALYNFVTSSDPDTPNPSELILDMMGFPKDNTLEIEDPNDPGLFVRDYLKTIIYDGITNKVTPEEILAQLKKEHSELDNIIPG